ncbi:glycoside hydrolase family 31 protein [Gallaecimonas kandeliae]|uniref:glycoside hydrolase family 31 protein n=1 Tax=Gallaecimonas kandeliae TaxID=3029055 RepID=UPI0026491F93|nr:TIM-barrel domain-containing protein [Gallaecimonas kandeliae]WKE66583.1 glycoside hydrolase family 31 protein [Gallaecimonas kandeliae]
MTKTPFKLAPLAAPLALLLLAGCASEPYQLSPDHLALQAKGGELVLTPLSDDSLQVEYREKGLPQPASRALLPHGAVKAHFEDQGDHWVYQLPALRAEIDKQSLHISYYKGKRLLLSESTGFLAPAGAPLKDAKGVELGFKLQDGEKLMGGGERVLGMDRRGHKLPLYNKASYGYTTEAAQMYYSLPMVISSNKYLLLFDNTASGEMDLGAGQKDQMQFSAVGGRRSYVLVAGEHFKDLTEDYTSLTGHQPLPPRWALGNFASRFGYHSEAEARDVVARFKAAGIPLDAIVLDLYWFGKDVKGHMGNLDWDKAAFPTPEKMIADFKKEGVKTVLITEPFILTTSKCWDEAVKAGAITPDATGKPATYDFYFGHTGLVDVFSQKGRDWFWGKYQQLLDQGVAGFWGDLGEPEVHPANLVHAEGSADELHNAYGHRWAQMVFERSRKAQPQNRPFILMRSGYAGSQRFGMMPWTGDVSRSWGGFKPQVELALQMGAQGLGYIHSDLGGFAGGDKFDPELYLRWLQYGVFQPVFRPHAQEEIAPEPVFHDAQIQKLVGDYVKLRYSLLPYNYTLAFENSQSGLPLMRSLMLESDDVKDFDNSHSYFWGDAFLVTPVTEQGARTVTTQLPKGAWFDFWSGKRVEGGRSYTRPTQVENLPVLVKAGSFVPMVDPVQSTDSYSSKDLTLHYWADASVPAAKGQMYEDDGKTFGAFAKGQYQLLQFQASQDKALKLQLSSAGQGYPGMPKVRELTLKVHHVGAVKAVSLGGQPLSFRVDGDLLTTHFSWDGSQAVVTIQ